MKGNMIRSVRCEHHITRYSRFFKKISEKCFDHAMSLLESKVTEKVDKTVTFIFNKGDKNRVNGDIGRSTITRPEQTESLGVAINVTGIPNESQATNTIAPRRQSLDNVPIATESPVAGNMEQPQRYTLRRDIRKPDYYDSYKKTHEKSGK